MRVKTLQIVWHSKEPVYSVDFCGPSTFVTAGADKEVKLWKVSRDAQGDGCVEHLSSLSGHSRTVNCVRYSPSGSQLVSSGDGGEIILWQACDAGDAVSGSFGQPSGEAAPAMRRAAMLRGHSDDVMDVCWASDGAALVSGSIDNKAMVWDMAPGKRCGALLAQLAQHKHFVQGVAWDPHLHFVVSQGADRACRVYALRPPAVGKRKVGAKAGARGSAARARDLYCSATLSRTNLVDVAGPADRAPLFQDETLPSFFRRLTWSPEGSMLAVPAGIYQGPHALRPLNAVHIYARECWGAPALHLAGHAKPAVVTRWCPVLFKLPATGSKLATIDLPYRMILAVGTLDGVVLYDTTSARPLLAVGALHYDTITDIAWSDDAQYLVVSSRDCYCSIMAFDQGELGEALDAEEAAKYLRRSDSRMQRPEADGEGARRPVELAVPGDDPNQVQRDELSVPVAQQSTELSAPAMINPAAMHKRRRIEPIPVSVTSGAPKDSAFASPRPSGGLASGGAGQATGCSGPRPDPEGILTGTGANLPTGAAPGVVKRRVVPTQIGTEDGVAPAATTASVWSSPAAGLVEPQASQTMAPKATATRPTAATNTTIGQSRRRITPLAVGPKAPLSQVLTPREGNA